MRPLCGSISICARRALAAVFWVVFCGILGCSYSPSYKELEYRRSTHRASQAATPKPVDPTASPEADSEGTEADSEGTGSENATGVAIASNDAKQTADESLSALPEAADSKAVEEFSETSDGSVDTGVDGSNSIADESGAAGAYLGSEEDDADSVLPVDELGPAAGNTGDEVVDVVQNDIASENSNGSTVLDAPLIEEDSEVPWLDADAGDDEFVASAEGENDQPSSQVSGGGNGEPEVVPEEVFASEPVELTPESRIESVADAEAAASSDDSASASPTGRPPQFVEVVTEHGSFRLRLRREWAPRHVEWFLQLLEGEAWRTWRFHRVRPGHSVFLGAHPKASSSPGSERSDRIVAETIGRNRSWAFGAVRAPRLSNPERATVLQQFYVCLTDRPELDGEFSVFGTVDAGFEVFEKLTAGSPHLNGAVLPFEAADGLIDVQVR